mgnify:FL=1
MKAFEKRSFGENGWKRCCCFCYKESFIAQSIFLFDDFMNKKKEMGCDELENWKNHVIISVGYKRIKRYHNSCWVRNKLFHITFYAAWWWRWIGNATKYKQHISRKIEIFHFLLFIVIERNNKMNMQTRHLFGFGLFMNKLQGDTIIIGTFPSSSRSFLL